MDSDADDSQSSGSGHSLLMISRNHGRRTDNSDFDTEPDPLANSTLAVVLAELQQLRKAINEQNNSNRKLVEKLTDEVVRLRSEVRTLKGEGSYTTIGGRDGNLLPRFPIDTMEDIHQFNADLESNAELQMQFKQMLPYVGGDNVTAFARNAMKKVLNDELAVKFSWKGTKVKPSFEKYFIVTLIREVCYEKFHEVDDTILNKVLQKHMLHARDRVEKRQKPYIHTSNSAEAVMPKFPIETPENFAKFDTDLHANPALQIDFKRILSKISGNEIEVFLHNAIKKIMTDELANKYTWKETKMHLSFEAFYVVSLIEDVCYERFEDADELKIHSALEQHFIHAKDHFERRLKTKTLVGIADSDKNMNILSMLPFKSMESVCKFDTDLQENPSLQMQFKQIIVRVGGDDVATFVRNAIRKIVTDGLAIDFTWRGTKTKPSFKSFFIVTIIEELCQENFSYANNSKVHNILQQHFLHAKDRFLKRKSHQIVYKPQGVND